MSRRRALIASNDSPVVTAHTATVTGLGNEDPTTVTFSKDSGFPTTFEDVTIDGNVFVKFTTFYRKINTIVDGQITSFTIADAQVDSTYQPYPCFVKTDGTIAAYVLIGKYCCSSSSVANSVDATYVTQTLATGRTNARALGDGYQLYDWKLQKLFTDLALVISQKVNFNDGIATISNYLGIYHLENYIWIDGLVQHTSQQWEICYDPSKYVSSATPTSDGYTVVGYLHTTTTGCIKKLGYDANNPFFNYPEETTGATDYSVYYTDRYYARANSGPVNSNVGLASASNGLWFAYAYYGWTSSSGVRLCKIP